MDAKVEPQAMKNRPQLHPPLSPTFSSLPDEIIVNCLARISRSNYLSLSLVSKRFRSLISSPDLYAARSQIGATEPCLYVCLRWPTHHRWYTLNQTLITDGGEIKDELTLVPIKCSPSNYLAIVKSTAVAVGSEIYQIGGTVNGKYSSTVHVFDCLSHTWRDAPSMTVERVYAKSWFLDGKIYVTGGCRKSQKSMNWGEVFDLTTQNWKPLPSPREDQDGIDPDHKALFLEGKLYIITKDDKYSYDPKERKWVFEEGFVGLERNMTGRWCVIDNVVFIEEGDCKLKWYDSGSGKWLNVNGLEDLDMKRSKPSRAYCTYDLLNYGGKLGIIWVEWIKTLNQGSRVWFAVIRLEKRWSSFGLEIWGVIERCNIVVPRVPDMPYTYLTCLSVSV